MLRAMISNRMFLTPPLVDPVHPPEIMAKISNIQVQGGHKL
ncbi:Uncharacterised protein [Segatella copri]|nr:Uncharacterised protein [Segatella copri]